MVSLVLYLYINICKSVYNIHARTIKAAAVPFVTLVIHLQGKKIAIRKYNDIMYVSTYVFNNEKIRGKKHF